MSDGHVLWLTSPKAPDSDDNIFHVGDEGQNDYNGNESPMDARDSFLVQ
jgi:hypothetical protein